MSYWDTSALVKLYLDETDSAQFRALAARTDTVVTAAIGRFEARATFRRREADGSLSGGGSVVLYERLKVHVSRGAIVIQSETVPVENEFGAVLEACFSRTPALFVRTNDALHLASARAAGETEFVTADARQRAAALALGFTLLP